MNFVHRQHMPVAGPRRPLRLVRTKETACHTVAMDLLSGVAMDVLRATELQYRIVGFAAKTSPATWASVVALLTSGAQCLSFLASPEIVAPIYRLLITSACARLTTDVEEILCVLDAALTMVPPDTAATFWRWFEGFSDYPILMCCCGEGPRRLLAVVGRKRRAGSGVLPFEAYNLRVAALATRYTGHVGPQPPPFQRVIAHCNVPFYCYVPVSL